MSGEGVMFGGPARRREPLAATDSYPFRDHRSIAETDAFERGREAERADVLALIGRRLSNAMLVNRGAAQESDAAQARIRELAWLEFEIVAGRHVGEDEFGIWGDPGDDQEETLPPLALLIVCVLIGIVIAIPLGLAMFGGAG